MKRTLGILGSMCVMVQAVTSFAKDCDMFSCPTTLRKVPETTVSVAVKSKVETPHSQLWEKITQLPQGGMWSQVDGDTYKSAINVVSDHYAGYPAPRSDKLLLRTLRIGYYTESPLAFTLIEPFDMWTISWRFKPWRR